MRTTLAIDDDVLAAAKHLAERQRSTVGDVISALARQGLAQGAGGGQARPKAAKARNGIPLLPHQPGQAPVTLAQVNQLRDELA